jgi:dihydroorotate dehydrogenase electron transfer subunit
MKQLEAKVLSNEPLWGEPRGTSTWLMRLEAPEVAPEARPGQFIMVGCGEDTVVPRPLSIHRVDGDALALLFGVVGKGTGWLSRRQKGETLNIFGPLGNGFTVKEDAKNLLLVAGGLGIAPLRFLVDTALKADKKVTLINGAAAAACLLPISLTQDLFDAGVNPASLNVVNTTEDGSEGFKGMATDLIPAYLDGADQVFACGPAPMYRTMSRLPELKSVSVQVSLEIMMGCGVGVCYGCTIRTKSGLKRVCQDGPVFELGEVEWETGGNSGQL